MPAEIQAANSTLMRPKSVVSALKRSSNMRLFGYFQMCQKVRVTMLRIGLLFGAESAVVRHQSDSVETVPDHQLAT